mmetsp:Transcript_93091/g.168180  ORF Transcript_93091/g.168180 Transcript_93091/m.168180 type:complete len:99 (-) Transcript_93091:369-665(-)
MSIKPNLFDEETLGKFSPKLVDEIGGEMTPKGPSAPWGSNEPDWDLDLPCPGGTMDRSSKCPKERFKSCGVALRDELRPSPRKESLESTERNDRSLES